MNSNMIHKLSDGISINLNVLKRISQEVFEQHKELITAFNKKVTADFFYVLCAHEYISMIEKASKIAYYNTLSLPELNKTLERLFQLSKPSSIETMVKDTLYALLVPTIIISLPDKVFRELKKLMVEERVHALKVEEMEEDFLLPVAPQQRAGVHEREEKPRKEKGKRKRYNYEQSTFMSSLPLDDEKIKKIEELINEIFSTHVTLFQFNEFTATGVVYLEDECNRAVMLRIIKSSMWRKINS